MAARLLVAVLAIAVVAVLVDRRAELSACEDARRSAFAAGFKRATEPPRAIADRLLAHCGTTGLIASAGALSQGGAPEEGRRLAEAAARREPENARAWEALRRQVERTDPARAQEAARRLRALDARS
jgi:hypothetical protein